MARLTFNSVISWSASYFWAPDGFTADDLSSWQIGPTSLSIASLDPFAITAKGLSLSTFSTPPNTDLTLLGGQSNVGGLLCTYDTLKQEYGYFEMRAQLPAIPGTVSAFWLAPTDGSWPPEIDVFEVRGSDPSTLLATVHSADGTIPISVNVPDMSQAFHTFGLEWTAATITWFFDGTKVAQVATPSDMHQSMYLLTDEETGSPGSWEGQPSAPYRATMNISYVHAYDSNPYLIEAANVGADAITGSSSGGMLFIYSQDHHSSTISDFNPSIDVLDFTNTRQTFATISITAASDGHAVIESDHNIINLPGVPATMMNNHNVVFNIAST